MNRRLTASALNLRLLDAQLAIQCCRWRLSVTDSDSDNSDALYIRTAPYSCPQHADGEKPSAGTC